MNLIESFIAWNKARPQRKAARAERRRLKDLGYNVSNKYDRIKAELRFNPKDADFTFEDRLKSEYGWNDAEVADAIMDYMRFMAIAVVADGPVVPTKRADMVWKQHILYGRNYVSGFCGKILYRFVHRKASVDVEADREAGAAAWARTQEAYKAAFGDPAANGWDEHVPVFANAVAFPSSSAARTFLREKQQKDDGRLSPNNPNNSSSGIDPLSMYLFYVILIQPHYNSDTQQHITKNGNDAATVVSDPALGTDGTDATFDTNSNDFNTDSGTDSGTTSSCSSCSSGSSCSS